MSGGGGTVPKSYMPSGSPTMDINEQSLMQGLYPMIQSQSTNLLGNVQGTINNMLQNPDRGLAYDTAGKIYDLGTGLGQMGLQGANQIFGAAQTGFNQVAPGQLAAMQALYGEAGQQRQAGSSLIDTQMQQLLPQQLAAAQQLYGMGGQLQGYGNQTLGTEFGQVLPGQLGAANAQYGLGGIDASMISPLIQAAFDPQSALYSRTAQQTMDMVNAQAAQSGLGGSPYAAGLAADAARNFNIDWQNNQLSRMLAGAGGAGSLATGAGNLFAGGANTAGSAISGALNTMAGAYTPAAEMYAGGQGMQNNATGAAMNVVNNAYNGANASYMGGSQLGTQAMNTLGQSADLLGGGLSMGQSALNTMQTAGMLPYETQNAMMLSQLGALGAQADINNAAYSPYFNYANAANNYLGVGQNAVNLNQRAQEQQFQQNQSVWGGLGSLAGSLFNVASNPFSLFGKQMWGGGSGGGGSDALAAFG